jgi:hypothetical protein
MRTALHWAVVADWKMLRTFGDSQDVFTFATKWVSLGLDCNLQDRDGNTALHLAARNCVRCVTALLQAAPANLAVMNVNVLNAARETPLHNLLRLNEEDPSEALRALVADHGIPNTMRFSCNHSNIGGCVKRG